MSSVKLDGVLKAVKQPRGSHSSRIGNMPDDMKKEITDRLSEWLR